MSHFDPARRTELRFLADCPKCKFGTVDRRTFNNYATNKQEVFYRCADCGAKWTEEQWNALHPPAT